MPMIVTLKLFHSFARNGVCDNDSWLFKNCLSFFHGINNFLKIVPVDLKHMPVERLPLGAQVFEWHDIFCVTFNLNVVTVNDSDKVVQTFFSGKHHPFPGVALIEL